jgi:hypothetical protein
MKRKTDAEILALAKLVRETDYETHERERSDALDAFCDAVSTRMSKARAKKLWERDCYKATDDEMVEIALETLGLKS